MSVLGDLASQEQRRAADPNASAWVSASAGSGKTKVLVDRLLNLLLAGAAPHKLLCLTYTKAAAAEMSNRLTRILSAWVTYPEDKLEEALSDLTGHAPDAKIKARARRLFAQVLDAPGGLRIQTLHAFAQSLLARFPLEAGVAPHFTVMDERDQAELLQTVIGGLLAKARSGEDEELAQALADIACRIHESRFADLLRELTAARARMARLFERLGGASGVAQAVAAHLQISPGTTAQSLLADACRESAFDGAGLRRAVIALSGSTKSTDRKKAETMASWLSAGEEARGSAFDKFQDVFLTQKLEPRSKLTTNEVLAAMPGIEDILLAEQKRLLAELDRRRSLECGQATGALLVFAERMQDGYRHLKAARARLDYEDLIQAARRLIQGGVSWVLYKLDGGIDHVLIDEAQDTSFDQWDIVRTIAAEFFAGESARPQPRTLFAVGDVKQSIYSFQGADPEAFERMRGHFAKRAPEGAARWEDVELMVSFRSARAVLEAVDAVFAEGEARAGVDLGQGYARHHAFRESAGGAVELWPPLEPKEIDEPEAWRPPVEAIRGDSAQGRMAKLLARRIKAMLQGERLLSKDRPILPGDILILLRRRGKFAVDLVRELKRENVPVAGVDRLVVTEQIAVADLMALARFALLPEDDLNLACVLKGPFLNYDEDRLFRACHGRKGHLWESLGRLEPQTTDWLADLLAQADRKTPFDFFAHLLGPLGGRRLIAARLGHEALDAVDEFMNLALAHQAQHPPSLSSFLAWMDRGAVEIKRDPEPGQGGVVRLMTVHGAKGLQAPIVFLPDTLTAPKGRDILAWSGADEEGLPLWAPTKADRPQQVALAMDLAAERQRLESHRLLYVAMTRAEDRLIIGGWRPGREAPGAWYPLIHQGFQRVAAQEAPDSFLAGDPDGPGETVLSFICPQRETPKTKEKESKEIIETLLPDWARLAAPAEPQPARPLIPSRSPPDEEPAPSPLSADGGQRFRRGLLIHRLLQTLPDQPAGQARRMAAVRYLDHAAADWPEDVRIHLIQEVESVLERPDFSDLFGPNSQAEAPLVGFLSDQALSGQVDRLALVGDEVWIADYKTNRPVPAGSDQVPPAYRRQMSLYRQAAESIWPGRKVRCFLLWTDGPSLMEV